MMSTYNIPLQDWPPCRLSKLPYFGKGLGMKRGGGGCERTREIEREKGNSVSLSHRPAANAYGQECNVTLAIPYYFAQLVLYLLPLLPHLPQLGCSPIDADTLLCAVGRHEDDVEAAVSRRIILAAQKSLSVPERSEGTEVSKMAIRHGE